MPKCHYCSETRGVRHKCDVCKQTCCLDCCKRYLSLAEAPAELVLTCTDCFLQRVAWASDRTHDVLGPADGRVVVLVHGALIGRQCLVQEARALAAEGFRVILPDLPAHGARFREPLTLANALTTLHDVITSEAPGQKVMMMGFSMGGYVAAAFAAAHPELMAGVLMGGCGHDTHTTAWKLVGWSAELVYRVCSPKTKAQFIYKSYPEVMRADRPLIQECFLRAGAEMDAWRFTWRVMYDADMHALLPRITCPALLVLGEKDFRSHEMQWLAHLRRGQLLVLKDGLHQFMMQEGVAELFRAEAAAFARAAEWGPAGGNQVAGGSEERQAATADGARSVAGKADSVVAAAAAAEPLSSRVRVLAVEAPPGAGQKEAAGDEGSVVPAAGPRVGLAVVFSNLWKQRKAAAVKH